MTTSQVRSATDNATDEESIGNYLRQNPDFFVRNEPLLAHLRLPHARGSAAVSLVERQVEVLREKNQSLESKLGDLVRVARGNEVLAEKIHRFTRRLMGAGSKHDIVVQIEKSLREDFEAFQSVLVVFGGAAAGLTADRFVNIVSPTDPALGSFETLFAAGKPRCGQVRDSQRVFLFGAESADIGSVALVPLGGKSPFGLLVLGSNDRERFHPGMSTEFLGRMGQLVSDALLRR